MRTEPSPVHVLNREQAIELAGSADVDVWCVRRGIPVAKQRDGSFIHGTVPALHMNGSHWYREEQQKGPRGEYCSGCLIEYVIEYEGMEFQQAVEEIIADIAPGVRVCWEESPELEHQPAPEQYIRLSVRMQRARALLESSCGQLH